MNELSIASLQSELLQKVHIQAWLVAMERHATEAGSRKPSARIRTQVLARVSEPNPDFDIHAHFANHMEDPEAEVEKPAKQKRFVIF